MASKTKVCAGCHIEKPLRDFYRDRRRPAGRESRCRTCRAAYDRKRNQTAKRKKATRERVRRLYYRDRNASRQSS